jgi:hypothetical protein
LCMHRKSDEEVQYVFRMRFEWPTTWYRLFFVFEGAFNVSTSNVAFLS